MARSWLLVLPFGLIIALLFASTVAQAAVVEHTFNVGNLSISQLCQPARIITAVNGELPGPTIQAREGDMVVVHLVNQSPYNMTIHWHGVFQRGPAMVTQCPVKPGAAYTYRFNVTDQEGTLWWHAHISFLRATVHGALVILPRAGAAAYPFPKPDGEEIVVLGEWWNANVYDLERSAFVTGNPARNADAYTINGKPGDFYNCSNANQTYRLQVQSGETYSFTVVAADAAYTTPYDTDVVVIAPGQTVDALMVAGAAAGRYYMAASPYDSAMPVGPPFSMTTATAVVEYAGSTGQDETPPPQLPPRPAYTDTGTAFRFFSSLTALVLPGKPTVPLAVDTRMFVTVGLGFSDCPPAQPLCSTNGTTRRRLFSASMNNESFVLPAAGAVSMLQAHYAANNASSGGVYTCDFPDQPPVIFDYTGNASDIPALQYAPKSTKVKTLRYNETVEMVLQNTRLVANESHPMHLHGFNFFVLAQGFGNYDEAAATPQFNLVNPQERNTVAVPTGGMSSLTFVIILQRRFIELICFHAGMWFMHCHFEAHIEFGLSMVFEVQDGPTAEISVPPPPLDLPQC